MVDEIQYVVLSQAPIVVVNKPRLGWFARLAKWVRTIGDQPRCPLCFDFFEPKTVNEGGGYSVREYCRGCTARSQGHMFNNQSKEVPPGPKPYRVCECTGCDSPRAKPLAVPTPGSGRRIWM
jgi:hypothetical protein